MQNKFLISVQKWLFIGSVIITVLSLVSICAFLLSGSEDIIGPLNISFGGVYVWSAFFLIRNIGKDSENFLKSFLYAFMPSFFMMAVMFIHMLLNKTLFMKISFGAILISFLVNIILFIFKKLIKKNNN